MDKNRIQSLDIAKGILMVLVVVGHSDASFSKYIYWFHMPAFFMISGTLMKDSYKKADLKDFIINRGKKLGLTYFVYFMIILSVKLLVLESNDDLSEHFVRLIFGGRLLIGEFGVFWFITCLFVSQILFIFLFILTSSNVLRLTYIIILYLIAHLQSKYSNGIYIPWNADTAFIAVFYMFMGYYSKGMILWIYKKSSINLVTTIFCLLLAAFLIVQDAIGRFSYNLDLKYNNYHELVLDILLPALFFTIIILISNLIEKYSASQLISYIGINSIIIMYLHLVIKQIYVSFFSTNWIIISLLGFLIPLSLSIFIKRYQKLRKVLLSY